MAGSSLSVIIRQMVSPWMQAGRGPIRRVVPVTSSLRRRRAPVIGDVDRMPDLAGPSAMFSASRRHVFDYQHLMTTLDRGAGVAARELGPPPHTLAAGIEFHGSVVGSGDGCDDGQTEPTRIRTGALAPLGGTVGPAGDVLGSRTGPVF